MPKRAGNQQQATPPSEKMRLLPIVIVLVAVVAGFLFALDHAPPSFDPKVLTSIIAHVQEKNKESPLTLNETVVLIQKELKKAYPNQIHIHDQWLFNLAGGFKTGILLVHASLTEYVAIWGSAVDTTGHSGRNWAEFHDWIISGNGTWWHEGSLDVEHHLPYSYVYTEPFAGRIVKLQPGTFMLEYCKGVIPALLPFGLGDSLISSLDPLLVWKSMSQFGKMTIHALSYGKI